MDFTFGEERVLYIKEGEIWKPIACLTSNPFDESVEMLKTTTRVSNGWRTAIPTNQSYTIGFDGMQIATGDGGNEAKLSYDRLKLIKRSRQLIEWKMEDSQGYYIDTGFGHIIDIGEANEVDGLLLFSGTIEGYGEPTFSRNLTQGDLFQDGSVICYQDGVGLIF